MNKKPLHIKPTRTTPKENCCGKGVKRNDPRRMKTARRKIRKKI